MKNIPLSGGLFAVVDDEDYESLSQSKWYAWMSRRRNGDITTAYAMRNVIKNGRRTVEPMHRVLMGVTDPRILVDHRNRNGLDNRRKNIRLADGSQNNANSALRIDNTSGHKGVTFDKRVNRWAARIKVKGKYRSLGTHSTVELAAAAYRAASLEISGEFSPFKEQP